MTDIILSSKSEIQATNTSQTKSLQLRETLIGLMGFDMQSIDSAKIIYFRKKDCASPSGWFGVIVSKISISPTL